MSNSFNISMAVEVAAVQAVVNEIREVKRIEALQGFKDNFDKVAHDAVPDATNWSVVENAGTVKVKLATANEPGYVECDSGGATGDDALVSSYNKRTFSLKSGVTTLHIKASVRFNWSADNGDNCGIGIIRNEQTLPDGVARLINSVVHVASVVVHDQAPAAYASDGTTAENADLSAFISDNVWFTLEIVISASDVMFYIDDTWRATLNTNVPSTVWQIVFGSTTVNNTNQYTHVEKIEVESK